MENQVRFAGKESAGVLYTDISLVYGGIWA